MFWDTGAQLIQQDVAFEWAEGSEPEDDSVDGSGLPDIDRRSTTAVGFNLAADVDLLPSEMVEEWEVTRATEHVFLDGGPVPLWAIQDNGGANWGFDKC